MCIYFAVNSSAWSCSRIHVIDIVILLQAKSETRDGSDTDPYDSGFYRASQHGDQFLHKEYETQMKGDWFPVPPPPVSKHGSMQVESFKHATLGSLGSAFSKRLPAEMQTE